MAGAPLNRRFARPGRLRFDVIGLGGRAGLAQAIETAVGSVPGVTAVRADTRSASLLVSYDPASEGERIEAAVRGAVASLGDPVAWPVVRAGSALFRVLGRSVPSWQPVVAPIALTAGAHSLDILQGVLSISIVNVASGVVPPVLLRLGVRDPRTQLKLVGGAGMAVLGAALIAEHYRKRAWHRLSRSAEHRLRIDTFRQLEAQDLAFFDQHGTGPLLNLLTDQVASVGGMVAGADEVIELMVTIVVTGGALVRASPGVALISAMALPASAVSAQLLGRNAAQQFGRRASAHAQLTQVLENILSGIVEVKSFTAEDREAERVDTLSRALNDATSAADAAALAQSSVIRNIFLATASGAVWYGAQRVIGQRMARHQLTRVIYWIPRLMGAFASIAQLSGTYYAARAGAERLEQVLASTPNIRRGQIVVRADEVRGEIAIDQVSFAYDPAMPVLRGVSLTIPPGTTLGIVGPTGSGKSTLLWLLLRLYEPESGEIRLDGADIASLELESLRACIALVSQDVYLFDDTIENNVRYGRPDASPEDVAAALVAAGAADLPQGAHTRLGERGHRLSGGQRQRVALARALLKNAPILALDEATSHLDYETEAFIKSTLRSQAANRTVILIAHRLASVRDADNIVVLDRGTITEAGTHQQLLAERGVYFRLWQLEVG